VGLELVVGGFSPAIMVGGEFVCHTGPDTRAQPNTMIKLSYAALLRRARAGRSRYVGISTNSLCMLCGRWRDRTSGVALRGEASNHLQLHWLKTVVVSVKEKAAGSCQVWDREDERE
jgi:hypothetical protein